MPGLPRRRPRLPVALLFGAAALLYSASAGADFFSQSPGPLAEAHKQIDGSDNCQKCHTEGRNLANDKCLACHEPIRKMQQSGRGFHATGRVLGKQCFLCHTNHKGRGRDIFGFAALGGKDKFDHNDTSFPLRQKHAQVQCEKCHDQREGGRISYIKAPSDCAGCHKQPHGELRVGLKRCERCHDAASWKEIAKPQFDHDKLADARYPLEAKHDGVPCLKCHAKWVFRASFTVPDCTPCHNNVHGDSLFGRKRCAFCHSARVEWKRISFDHGRQTKFALDGGHAGKACVTCHPKDTRVKPDRACGACHKDVHNARFKAQGDCATCHTSATWTSEIRFDHKSHTRFNLTGAHVDVDCRACHRGKGPTEWERFDGRTIGCMGCHQHANVHKRQFKDSECLRCHTMAGENKFKKQAVNQFHGPGTRFPLTEGHAGVACEKCHKNDVYQGTPLACGPACHADQLHKGTLGDKCLSCHAGGHWAATRFDHDQSAFPLIGHHQDVRCEACHPARKFKPLDTHCAGCHKSDDAHGGTLGDRCELCHSPTGRSLFDHNNPRAPNRFRIEGGHLHVRCQGCHKDTLFPKTPRTCEGCHGEPAVHKGQLGVKCGSCHDVVDWRSIHTGHNTPAFRFGGAHDRIACVYCHPNGQVRRNTGQLCGSCHQNDDIHHNSLGPRCGECHTQQSFSPARFFHERVGCDLRGIHRTLPCNDCHVGGHFAALSPSCVSCHRTDAVKAATADPLSGGMAHAGYTTCSICHNTTYFKPAPKPSGSESVCR